MQTLNVQSRVLTSLHGGWCQQDYETPAASVGKSEWLNREWRSWVPLIFAVVFWPCSSQQCNNMSVCLIFSSSKQGHDDSVCPGDGVGVKHGTRQTLHMALFGERPAAGRVPHQRRCLWPAVSFADLSAFFLPFQFICLILQVLCLYEFSAL